MRLQERRVMLTGLAVAAAAAVALLSAACKDSNSITAPAATSPSAAVNVAGTWTGSFESYSTTGATSSASATFQQNGSDVTGTLAADSCGIRGAFRGTVSGKQLTGRLGMRGCLGGAVSGTVSESGLSLTIGDFTKPVLTGDTILMYGGAASLHR
jgi:hypothetical protein